MNLGQVLVIIFSVFNAFKTRGGVKEHWVESASKMIDRMQTVQNKTSKNKQFSSNMIHYRLYSTKAII